MNRPTFRTLLRLFPVPFSITGQGKVLTERVAKCYADEAQCRQEQWMKCSERQ